MRTRTVTKTAAVAMGRAASATRNHAPIDNVRRSVTPLPPTRGHASSPLVSELEFVGCDAVSVNYDQYVLLREAKRRFELWDRGAGAAWEVRDGPTGVHEWPIQALTR